MNISYYQKQERQKKDSVFSYFTTDRIILTIIFTIKMKENKYDDNRFFELYNSMPRSTKGLEAAGEWHILKDMLPDFENKRVLDLGCGMG